MPFSTTMPQWKLRTQAPNAVLDVSQQNNTPDSGEFMGYDPNNNYGVITKKTVTMQHYENLTVGVGSFEIGFRAGPYSGLKFIKAVLYHQNNTANPALEYLADPTGQYINVLASGALGANPALQSNLNADTDSMGKMIIYIYFSNSHTSYTYTNAEYYFRSLAWRAGVSDTYGKFVWREQNTGSPMYTSNPSDGNYSYQCVQNTNGFIVDGCFASNNCTIFGNLSISGPASVYAGSTHTYTVQFTGQGGLPFTSKLNTQTLNLKTFNFDSATSNYPHVYNGFLATVNDTTSYSNLAQFNVTYGLTGTGTIRFTVDTENLNRSKSGVLSVLVVPNNYTISPNTSTIAEGQSVTFNVTSTVPNGTVLYWTAQANGSTLTGADFTDGLMSGSVTISNGTASIVRTLLVDALTETEQFYLQLRSGSISGTVVATSYPVTITNTTTTTTTTAAVFTATKALGYGEGGGTITAIEYSKNGGAWTSLGSSVTFVATDTMSYRATFTKTSGIGAAKVFGRIEALSYVGAGNATTSKLVTIAPYSTNQNHTVLFHVESI